MSTMPVGPASAANTRQPPTWTRWHTAGLILIILAIGVLGVATPGLQLNKLACWLITLALFGAFLFVVGHGVTGRLIGLLIDERRKMSLSRLQMVLWTITILSGLLTVALTNIGSRAASPLAIAVPPELWLLMGISTTSLIGSPLLRSNKFRDGKIKTRDDLNDADVADLFRGEEKTNCEMLDLAKVQMFFFTLVLVLSYAVLLGSRFSSSTDPLKSLPEIDQSMVALLGISHAGYLANKAIPRSDAPPPHPAG